MTTPHQDGPGLLLYDGECPLCQRARKWVEGHVPPEAIQTLPCQDERRAALAPMISLDTCMAAMQLILPGGRVYAGEKAFPHILRHTRYGRYFRWIFCLPGAGIAYRLIARNRLALSGLVARKDKGEGCTIDGDRDCR